MNCPKCQAENPESARFCAGCGAPLRGHEPNSPESGIASPGSKTETLQTPLNELTTGSTFAGRYQVIEELGRGGMGRVYKVFDTAIKEKVALKLIRPEVAADKDTIERFSNEIRLARRIGHRNVCRMFDLGEAERARFITMEYVHGEDLKSMIRMSGSLSLGMLLSVGKQVADGLAEAHGLGVVHRDLKPQNVMIDKNGNAKIMDFGIARSVREKGITGPSVMIGTPEYMSPEQAEAKEVDARSDVYSLGVILYEMATSRVPFEGETALSVAMKHKGEAPKSPRQLNPALPDDLAGVILKCLEKDKAKRYQSAADVRAELDRIEKGLPTTERFVPERRPITSRQITVQFSLKKLLAPALAVVAVLAAFVLWKALRPMRTPFAASGKPSLAVLYFENISADPALDDWKTGLTELLITDLSQSRRINVLGSDRIYGLLKRLGLDRAGKYSSDDLRRVAEEGRAAYTGAGSIMKAGEDIIITFALREPRTGRSLSVHKLQCRGEAGIASSVDELTRLIKADLNLTGDQISDDTDREIREITTSSGEALRFYAEGRRLNNEADFVQSVESYKKAVSLDPEFAMAYRALYATYQNMARFAEAEECLKKAVAFSSRVSERERLSIQATAEAGIDRRIALLDRLSGLYPDDPWPRQFLGWNYFILEEWDKALGHWEWRYRADPRNPLAISNLAELYVAMGRYEQAKKILEGYLESNPDNLQPHYDLALAHLCAGDPERARAEIDKAFSLSPTDPYILALKGDAFLCLGEPEKAEAEYRRLLRPDDAAATTLGLAKLWYLALAQGKLRQGRGVLEQAIDIARKSQQAYREVSARVRMSQYHLVTKNPGGSLEAAGQALTAARGLGANWAMEELAQHWELWPLLMKGLALMRLGSLDRASETAAEIEALGLYPAERRWHLYLLGTIALEGKDRSRAVSLFKEARALEPHQWIPEVDNTGFFLEGLARAYDQSGDLDNARRHYEEITRLTSGRIRHGDLYAKSFYRLGLIFERQGERAKAGESFRKFLGLWKDADPGISEVEDAKARLASLSGR